uniref:DUF4116 domain-containing protein n=1 Tax=Marseillevirus LCMAC201 TaxID=2506605 RepID=A0A481YWJ2_9VIRU|nr:MAG: protein of unknown function DUF4116 [Marseillevirus LCMAC201]
MVGVRVCKRAHRGDMSGSDPNVCGWALQFVKEQTSEICIAAVQYDGRALEYVEEQTTEICMAAVKKNGWALQLVKEQTSEICIAAVQKHVE